MEAGENGGKDGFKFGKMRNISAGCLLAFCLFLLPLQGSGQASQVKPTYIEIFQAVWDTVNERFYDPSFTGVDWKAVGDRYRPLAGTAKTDSEFHALMQKMLGELPVSHLHISMPAGTGTVGTGIQTHSIDGKTVVASVPEAPLAWGLGVRVGDMLSDPAEEPGTLGLLARLRLRGCDGNFRVLDVRRESHSRPERPSIRWLTFSAKI